MQKDKFTSKQLEKLTGLKIRTSHYYVEAGILTPDLQGATGTGTIRYYSVVNLMEAEIISYFIGFGLPKRVIASFFASLKKDNSRSKLDPFEILKCDGDISLFFLPDIKNEQVFHSFVSSKMDHQYLRDIDFKDYDLYPIRLTVNLKLMAKKLIEKLEGFDL